MYEQSPESPHSSAAWNAGRMRPVLSATSNLHTIQGITDIAESPLIFSACPQYTPENMNPALTQQIPHPGAFRWRPRLTIPHAPKTQTRNQYNLKLASEPPKIYATAPVTGESKKKSGTA